MKYYKPVILWEMNFRLDMDKFNALWILLDSLVSSYIVLYKHP